MAPAAAAREEGRFAGFGAALLLLGAILSGSLLGLWRPEAGERLVGWTDPVLLTLMTLLFFEMRLKALARGFADLRFLALAWGANFLILPFLGFALASFLLSGEPLLMMLGLTAAAIPDQPAILAAIAIGMLIERGGPRNLNSRRRWISRSAAA